MRAKTSKVYSYFDAVENDSTLWQCKTCFEYLRSTNTSNLWKHMQGCHPESLKEGSHEVSEPNPSMDDLPQSPENSSPETAFHEQNPAESGNKVSRGRTSKAYEYFDSVEDDRNLWKCKACHEYLRSTNTSNLWKHMQVCPPKFLQKGQIEESKPSIDDLPQSPETSLPVIDDVDHEQEPSFSKASRRRRTSNIYLYFVNINKEKHLNKCKVCHVVVKGASTANMWKHLLSRHRKLYKNIKSKEGMKKFSLPHPKRTTQNIASQRPQSPDSEIEDETSRSTSAPAFSFTRNVPTPPVNETKTTKPPETTEELLKEENKLLRHIVSQNQHVLSRTVEILEQNHKLIELLMGERNKSDTTGFRDESKRDDDTVENVMEDAHVEKELDGEDLTQFLTEELEKLDPGRNSIRETEKEKETDPLTVKVEEFSNDERDVDIEMMVEEPKRDELQIDKVISLPGKSKATTKRTFTKRRRLSTTIKNPSRIAKPQIAPTVPREKSKGIVVFPVTTVEELNEIDQRMAEEEDFKQTVLEYLKRVKLRGGGISQMINRDVLELKLQSALANGPIWRDANKLLGEAQSIFQKQIN